jgi:NTE family protein
MNRTIKNLVFEGGGVKGVAYLGSLQYLHDQKIINNVKNVAGTSAGAITALAIALDYSYNEIYDLLFNVDMNEFRDSAPGYIRDSYRLITQYNVYKGDKLSQWFKKIIELKTGNAETTFADMRKNGRKNLLVIGTNISRQEKQIFSYEETPDVPLWLAVRISMSIPFYFVPVKLAGDYFVDGGLSNNFFLNMFDKNDTKTMETLGFRVDSESELKTNKYFPINNIFDFIKVTMKYVFGNIGDIQLSVLDLQRVIKINTQDVSFVDFSMSKEHKEMLLKSGYEATRKFFQ